MGKIWITGAAGFVGRRLCARLARVGVELAPTDRELDLCDAAAVHVTARALRPSAVVHLAAVSLVPGASADPWRAFRVNVLGTRNLLAAVREAAPRARVLLASSALVYGPLPRGASPWDERAPLAPEGAYARSKAAADLLGAAAAARGLDVVRARPCNHTGAGRPEAFVESSLARRVVAIERGLAPPRLDVANAESVRDFCHVEDVIDAYLALLEPRATAGAYNVASGAPLTIGALAKRLAELAGVALELVPSDDPSRPADASLASAEKLRAATGWRPGRALDDALRELLEDWRARPSVSAQP